MKRVSMAAAVTAISVLTTGAAQAQTSCPNGPTVSNAAYNATQFPAPAGLGRACSGTSCASIQWGGATYWGYSYNDNRVGIAIVGYDSARNVINRIERSGVRYLSSIALDCNAQTATFTGQGSAQLAFRDLHATLTATRPATGGGGVADVAAGHIVSCGNRNVSLDRCVATVVPGTTAQLHAFPDPGYGFTGWTGACVGAGGSQDCNLTLLGPTAVSATFATNTLTVTASPDGRITADRIDCGATCSAPQVPGSSQTITATPVLGRTFGSWTGACAGQGNPCTILMSQPQTVSALYNNVGTQTLTLLAHSNGAVTGVDFTASGSNWVSTITTGRTIQLNASSGPQTGHVFDSWTGACAGQGATCTITMDQARTVGVSFRNVGTARLTITRPTNGGIADSSFPMSISCGNTNQSLDRCVMQVTRGWTFALQAFPNAGRTFGGWSGACAGTGGSSCRYTINEDATVGASFN